jgi:hypothetical protein
MSIREPLLQGQRCERANSCFLSDGTIKQADSAHKKVGTGC